VLASENLAGWRHPTEGWGIHKLVVVAREVVIAMHKRRDADGYRAQLDHQLTMARKFIDLEVTVSHNGRLCSKMGNEYWPSYSADVPP
jgi:hypothetical protein